ncbi:MAG: tRNA (guanosine(46)-N7)-methyltransferase TrmB [Gemmataceae bacterium]|nr:tRNA (guanosine(46)-N7)-methyltransferase TrmB [Gemmataceae bacterium]
MRRVNRLSLEELAPHLLETPDPPRPLVWSDVFGNDRPVEIEVGFGKGLFLLTASEACPDVNFLGIEIVRKYQLFTATRMAKRAQANVRLACADARRFLRDCVSPGSVQAVHVYFPDPWWKKRHLKRRLFTSEFAALCEVVLRPGGVLHLATDVEDYFAMATELVAQNTKLDRLPPPDEKVPAHDFDYLTNFERKFRKEGRPIHRVDYRKPS